LTHLHLAFMHFPTSLLDLSHLKDTCSNQPIDFGSNARVGEMLLRGLRISLYFLKMEGRGAMVLYS
jgi:hypothetical protein